jgi:hypothetical protein
MQVARQRFRADTEKTRWLRVPLTMFESLLNLAKSVERRANEPPSYDAKMLRFP